jgi:hypothetical protein
MACFNDLIGLQYKWGAHPSDKSGFTDCFALSMEARRRMGLHDFFPEFQWVYKEYDDEGVGGRQILRWIWERAQRTTEACNGAVFRTKGRDGGGIALATVINEQDALLIGPSKRVIVLPFATVTKGKFYWAD